MLFPIEPVDTNMVYLNEVLKHFINRAVSLSQYRKASLFPADFIPVHDNPKNAIESKFRAVFSQINNLNFQQRNRLKRMYANHQRTKRLCQGHIAIIDFSVYPDGFKKALKSLGEYLYISGLKNVQIKNLAIQKYGNNNSTLYDHSLAFKRVNGSICCFCGIQEYEEQLPNTSRTKWRPAYDHYLPKEKYPFAAVNFQNLIPCCYQCNSKAKGSIDPCNCDTTGRKKAKHPFDSSPPLGLKFKFVSEKLAADQPWVVELKDELDEAHQSWNRVYKIKERVSARLNAHYVAWLRGHHAAIVGAPTMAGKKAILLQKAIDLANEATQQREYIHQANLLATLSDVSDAMLDSILQAIKPDPIPVTKQAGIALLNNMGFSL
ncbi:MAG TPA: hypothetical protein DCS87_04925 [Rheinheimera sp.]|nr:hypothetical protein [Rheinheimera sp.]